MADYVSALTGPEIDEALADMASHTSEAWAVGTRNGVPVSGDDVTYNNSSKYWANRSSTYNTSAQAAAARAEAAVPSGTAGAVFFDRAQSLTDAQKAQVRTNIAASGTNPNILDNPWFTYPINQRGFSSGSTIDYTVDRWKNFTNGATVSLTSGYNGYLSIPANCVVAQPMESYTYASLVGKTVTLSAMYSDGTVTSGSITVPASGTVYATGTSVRMAMDGTNYRFLIYPAGAVQIRALKVELGSFSTLANDTIPNVPAELAKCQRYFIRLKNTVSANWAVGVGIASATGVVDMPVYRSMRATSSPTVSYNGTYTANGNAVTSIDAKIMENEFVIRMQTSGLTLYSAVQVFASAGAYIDISCDL